MKSGAYTTIRVGNDKPVLIGTCNSIAFLSFSDYQNYCFKVDGEPTQYSQSQELALDLKGAKVKIIVSDGKNNIVDLKIFNNKKLNISFLA